MQQIFHLKSTNQLMTAQLADTILNFSKNSNRYFIAISGPPGAGKTTLCNTLEKHLTEKTTVSVVAMDGFHYDNNILQKKGILNNKGSPDTFDVASLKLLLNGLHQQTEPLAVPVFDRKNDLARSSARLVHPDDHIILVEGNYLLCETHPWKNLHSLFDHTISIKTSRETLEQRLIQRWLDHNHTPEQAKKRVRQNDLPNADYVKKHSVAADTNIET